MIITFWFRLLIVSFQPKVGGLGHDSFYTSSTFGWRPNGLVTKGKKESSPSLSPAQPLVVIFLGSPFLLREYQIGEPQIEDLERWAGD